MLLKYILLASIFSVVLTFDLFGFPTYLTAPAPQNRHSASIVQNGLLYKSLQQKWDHFDPDNKKTFEMYYSQSEEFFNAGGPILISLSESALYPWEFVQGFLSDLARDYGGLMVVAEVRYTGFSWPVMGNLTIENLKYNTIEQKLEDIASLIRHIKEDEFYAGSKVFIMGCGLNANFATWMRMVHPELVDGAVASSAPVNIKPDFREYAYVLSENIAAQHGTECRDTIHEGFLEAKRLVENNDTKTFKERFLLCEEQSFAYDDISAFFNGYYNAFNSYTLQSYGCGILLDGPGTPLQKVSHYIREMYFPGEECLQAVKFNDIVEALDPSNENLEQSLVGRSLYYLFCNQVGLQMVSDKEEMLWGDSIPLELFTKNICSRAIDNSLDEATVLANIANTNKKYGGSTPNVTRVISVHGEISPIRLIGIAQDLNEDSPAFIIKDEDSCSDVVSDFWAMTPGILEAHNLVRKYFTKWMAE